MKMYRKINVSCDIKNRSNEIHKMSNIMIFFETVQKYYLLYLEDIKKGVINVNP